MARSPPTNASLHTRDGQRKYLTPAERQRFIAVAGSWPRTEVGTLCLLLAYSGCRISEALSLTLASVSPDDGTIAIRSLKKRQVFSVREIPLPVGTTRRLIALHPAGAPMRTHLWSLSRSRAWQLIKQVMEAAEIAPGPHCTPKGLRHGFGVHAIRSGVPITMVQRWLGHASLATTAVYTQVLGAEERDIARRMWDAATD